jgi:nitric oxide reductase activation protein
MKDAYDMAVWARPDLRERILADQRKAEDAKREADARKAAEDARKRAVSVKSNPSMSPNATPAGSLRDELERNWSSASF